MIGTMLLIVLILMLVGVLPTWPHSRNWGYYPSGGLGLWSGKKEPMMTTNLRDEPQ